MRWNFFNLFANCRGRQDRSAKVAPITGGAEENAQKIKGGEKDSWEMADEQSASSASLSERNISFGEKFDDLRVIEIESQKSDDEISVKRQQIALEQYEAYRKIAENSPYRLDFKYHRLLPIMQLVFEMYQRVWPQFRLYEQGLFDFLIELQRDPEELKRAEVFKTVTLNPALFQECLEAMIGWVEKAETMGKKNLSFLFYLLNNVAKKNSPFLGVLEHLENFVANCSCSLGEGANNFIDTMKCYFNNPLTKLDNEKLFLLSTCENLGKYICSQLSGSISAYASDSSYMIFSSGPQSIRCNNNTFLGWLMMSYPSLLGSYNSELNKALFFVSSKFSRTSLLGGSLFEENALKCAIIFLYATSQEEDADLIMDELEIKGQEFLVEQKDNFRGDAFVKVNIQGMISHIREQERLAQLSCVM